MVRQLLQAFFPIVASSVVVPPLQTSGSQILDSNGEAVRLACVNWYGAHMERFVVNGLDKRPVGDIAADIADLGFNCVRLVFSHDVFFKNPSVEPAAVSANPLLGNKPAMEAFDAVVDALTSSGVMVILNNHISDAMWCCNTDDGNGLWYTDTYPASAFQDMWVALTQRYKTNKFVVAADLRNELREAHGVAPTWGDGNVTTDWKMAAEDCSNAVLHENSDLLIIVEGLSYANDLSDVKHHPVQLSIPGRLVYSGHIYRWDDQFGEEEFSKFESAVHQYLTYVSDLDQVYTAPFWLGEFGVNNPNTYWNNTIELLARHPDFGWAYWSLDGYKHAGGAGDDESFGIFEQDYKTIRHAWKLRDLQSVQQVQPSNVLAV